MVMMTTERDMGVCARVWPYKSFSKKGIISSSLHPGIDHTNWELEMMTKEVYQIVVNIMTSGAVLVLVHGHIVKMQFSSVRVYTGAWVRQI